MSIEQEQERQVPRQAPRSEVAWNYAIALAQVRGSFYESQSHFLYNCIMRAVPHLRRKLRFFYVNCISFHVWGEASLRNRF